MRTLFFLTYAVANLSLVLYGLLALLMPDILVEPFALNVYRFPEDATGAENYLAALFRLLGYFNVILGLLGLLLLQRLRATREGWCLKIVILSTTLAYVGPIVFDNTVGTIGIAEIVEHVLFVLVIVLGLLMLRRSDAI